MRGKNGGSSGHQRRDLFPFFAVSSTLLSSPDEPRRYVRLVIYPPLTTEGTKEQSRQAEKLINRGEEEEIRIESEASLSSWKNADRG